MTLWPHQERAIEGAREELRNGARAPVIVSPTGGGKTRIGVEICAGAVTRGHRVLWLAHRRELVDQAAADLRRNGATGVGFIRAGHPTDLTRPIQVASIQTMLARARGCASLMPSASLVVFDECVTGDTFIGGVRADELRVGDLVPAWDGEALVWRRVKHRSVRAADVIVSLQVGARVLRCSDNHPIWIEGKGYVRADRVREGDLCRVLSAEHGSRRGAGSLSALARVDRVEIHERSSSPEFEKLCPRGVVYDFEVEGEHNFFANGILTHNCHHYVAAEWQAIAAHYAHAIRVGLTATPQRADGTSLGNLFDTLIQVASIRELTAAGFLVPCTVVRPDAKQGARTIAQDPVAAYREYAAGTQAIVFTPDVEEAKACAARFMSVGISAACVDGKLSPNERGRRIAGFKSGAIRVLTNCYVLTEGFDHPAVETCILARGCGVLATYLQIVGRVLRAAPGKSRALLLDLVGAVHTHGLPDDDREWTLEGNGCKKSDAEPVSQCRRCGAAFRPPAHCPICGVYGRIDPRPIHISGDRLSPVERGALSSDLEKQSYYEWLLKERNARGYKPGWIHHRFVARFGVPYDCARPFAPEKAGAE